VHGTFVPKNFTVTSDAVKTVEGTDVSIEGLTIHDHKYKRRTFRHFRLTSLLTTPTIFLTGQIFRS
jgi:hypothetical protein